MTRTLLEELAHRLRQDFSADNLGSAAALAQEGSWNSPSPLGLFVVTSVLRHLEQHWDVATLRDQAWMSPDALLDMEARLRPPLIDYLQRAGGQDLDCSEEARLLNAVVAALFRWTAEGPDPRPT